MNLLPGFEHTITERAEALAEAQGEELTLFMVRPVASIDGKTRVMEQFSPLFKDTDANPQGGLF